MKICSFASESTNISLFVSKRYFCGQVDEEKNVPKEETNLPLTQPVEKKEEPKEKVKELTSKIENKEKVEKVEQPKQEKKQGKEKWIFGVVSFIIGTLGTLVFTYKKDSREQEDHEIRKSSTYVMRLEKKMQQEFKYSAPFEGDIVQSLQMQKLEKRLSTKLGWMHLFYGPSGTGLNFSFKLKIIAKKNYCC